MKSDPENLIIDRPDLVPARQKLTAMGITLLFWGALLYLWQPLLSVLAWGLNIDLFYNHMILLGGYQAFLQLLAEYLKVIVALGGGLILWARINQWRFRGRDRRRSPGATDMQKLLRHFGVREETLAAAKNARIVKITISNGDKVSQVALVEIPRITQTPMASAELMR